MLTDLIKYEGYWPSFNTDLYLKYIRAKLAKELNEVKSHAGLQTKK
jgi:hypothetical protein